MKMFTVCADKRFCSCLGYIESRLGDKCSFKRTEFSMIIEVDKSNENMVEAMVLDALCEIIVTDCKAFYITEKLRVKIADSVTGHAFIRALSTFDYETDKILVGNLLKLTPTFLLSSFYDFCLDDLKRRWDEVCILANENIALLLCERNLNELLRYLIQNIDVKVNQVYLKQDGGRIKLLDRNMKEVTGVYVNPDLNDELAVVEKLVALAPRRIFFLGEWCEFFDKVAEMFAVCEAVEDCVTGSC